MGADVVMLSLYADLTTVPHDTELPVPFSCSSYPIVHYHHGMM